MNVVFGDSWVVKIFQFFIRKFWIF